MDLTQFLQQATAMTERCSMEEHIWTQPILLKYVTLTHSVPEGENLITGLQITHLIVCL